MTCDFSVRPILGILVVESARATVSQYWRIARGSLRITRHETS